MNIAKRNILFLLQQIVFRIRIWRVIGNRVILGRYWEGDMDHRRFSPAKGVSSIELFYDVMLVYCLGVLTSTMHHVEGGSFTFGQWLSFTFSYT